MGNQGWAPDGLDDLSDEPPQWIRVGVAMTPPTESIGGSTTGPTSAQLDAFCRALAPRVGLAVTAQGFSDYRALLAAINRGDADLAWLPPLVALRSASAGRTLPIVLPIRGGAAWYASALFTRVGSGISSIRDLQGARVAWVDPQSTAGFLVIRAWMRSQQIDFNFAFGQQTFYGSHAAVVQAVMRGEADVGATYAHLDHDLQHVRSAAWGTAHVQIVAMAGPIPNDVLSASIRLPVTTIRSIRDALVRQDEALRAASAGLLNAEGFIAAETEHMSPLMKVLKHLDDTGRRATSIFPSR
jgi:phosphonate transport system substrate-binding protein